MNPKTTPHAIKRDGVLFLNGKVFRNPCSPVLPILLTECHSTPTGDHFGFQKTLTRLHNDFRWPGMRCTVMEFIPGCDIYQRNKSQSLSSAGLVQPFSIPERNCSNISMDFIEGLRISEGHSVIMVVVDHLSKYAHFLSLSHPYIVMTVAKVFIREVLQLHNYYSIF